MICVAPDILVFADEVSVRRCQVRVPQKKCQARVSYECAKQEVSSKSVLQKCQVRVSYKSVK